MPSCKSPRCVIALALSVASVSTASTSTSLRDASLAVDGPFMGAAINAGDHKGDSAYAALAAAQYSLVTAENACKWATISPSKGAYNFDDCDYIYNTAKASGQAFRGHNLAWGNYNPSWVDALSPDDKRSALVEYISRVAARYPDAYAWDVYNEPVCDDFPFAAAAGLEICDGTDDGLNAIYKNSSWYPDVPDALELAFTTAADALESVNATGVKLFLNDYMAESSTGVLYAAKADRVYTLAQQLLAKGIPLHGIGMQFHLDLTYSSFDGVRANMKRLGELGLEVHVTELDVSCSLTETTCSWGDEDAEKQAKIYASLLQVCLDEPACTAFDTWGVTDKYTWRGTSQHPLPFDENLNSKAAVASMLEIFGVESDDGGSGDGDDGSVPAGDDETCAELYEQCGGTGWTGATTCCSGTCTSSGEYYSQCKP